MNEILKLGDENIRDKSNICHICKMILDNLLSLSYHIKSHKVTIKNYYDLFLKTKDDGFCKQCGNITKFSGLRGGYNAFCSIKCANNNKEVLDKIYKSRLKNSGIGNPFNDKDKIKKSIQQKYGVDHSSHIKQSRNKFRETWKIKTKHERLIINEKKKSTYLSHYGFDNYSKTCQFRKLARQLMVDHIRLGLKNGKEFSPNQGKNEFLFLEELQKFSDYKIKRSINLCNYFPDGFIDELKIVIEFDESFHNLSYHQERDARKDLFYKNSGFYIFRIKEDDWIKFKELVVEKFQILINNRKLENKICVG